MGLVGDSYEIDPKHNPSVMYQSQTVEESMRATNNNYNNRKKEQEFQNNAIPVNSTTSNKN